MTPSRSSTQPNHALTRNVLRALQNMPALTRMQLLAHLNVLDQGLDSQNPNHQEAAGLACAIICTVANMVGVIRTPEQWAVLMAEPRLLGLVQEALQQEERLAAS